MDNPRQIRKSVIGGPAAVIVLLAFFMPWITISCQGGFSATEETVSGYDMTQNQSENGQEKEGDTALWIIPFAAAVALLGAGLHASGSLKSGATTVLFLITGFLGLLIQLAKYAAIQSDMQDAEQQVGQGIIEVSYRYGWWLTALGLIAIVAAAFVSEEHSPEPRYGPGIGRKPPDRRAPSDEPSWISSTRDRSRR